MAIINQGVAKVIWEHNGEVNSGSHLARGSSEQGFNGQTLTPKRTPTVEKFLSKYAKTINVWRNNK